MDTVKDTSDYGALFQNLINRILKGDGYSTAGLRQAAFNNSDLPEPLHALIAKVANAAFKVTDGEVDAVKQSGVSEDEIFELIVCAAVGAASRQYENGLAALAEAMQEGGQHAS
ncbi:MAG: hypothetical protein ACTHMI_11435 [Mucilaginibacter sp.]